MSTCIFNNITWHCYWMFTMRSFIKHSHMSSKKFNRLVSLPVYKYNFRTVIFQHWSLVQIGDVFQTNVWQRKACIFNTNFSIFFSFGKRYYLFRFSGAVPGALKPKREVLDFSFICTNSNINLVDFYFPTSNPFLVLLYY